MNKTFLITGVAGFIGSNVAKILINAGHNILGVDNLNDYYSIELKKHRLADLEQSSKFKFYHMDIENFNDLFAKFQNDKIDAVINLAARAGVRHSLVNPFVYETTNTKGTLNLLEFCRQKGIGKFVMASTSSLYAGQPLPFKESLEVNTPISPYAASKKAAEMMAYTYHYLYNIDITVLRYFTVYGPAGRPDMSYFIFAQKIMNGEEIPVYGDGSQSRDFTYVQDIAQGTVKALKPVGFEIINLGNDNPHQLMELINYIEKFSGKKAKFNFKPFHKADMKATWADISKAREILGWEPTVSLEEGIQRLVSWMKENEELVRNVPLVL